MKIPVNNNVLAQAGNNLTVNRHSRGGGSPVKQYDSRVYGNNYHEVRKSISSFRKVRSTYPESREPRHSRVGGSPVKEEINSVRITRNPVANRHSRESGSPVKLYDSRVYGNDHHGGWECNRIVWSNSCPKILY